MRVVTVVGTRPEIIRLSRVMAALDKAVDHRVIHTGQNWAYELNEIFFEQMGIRKPDVTLTVRASHPAEATGNTMMLLVHPIKEINPDALLILGDTNSCVAAAYVAKRLKIPVFHMEAGNRCFDERVPEEINRRLIDHIADINLPYSDIARENLLREGLPSDRIIKTGSPLNEVLHHYENQINQSDVLGRLNLTENKYFVVSCHREENTGSLDNLHSLVNALAVAYKLPVIVSTHPRIAGRVAPDPDAVSSLVRFEKPFGFFGYNKLQKNALCTMSDSGSITEESSILGFPALNIREAHERPEGMEEASVIMTGMNASRVLESITPAQKRLYTPQDYLTLNVSDKVVRVIMSYVDYVNRNVWRR